MGKNSILTLLLLSLATNMQADNKEGNASDNIATSEVEAVAPPMATKKDGWLKRAVRWFGDAWTGYDPKYSIPSFYDWAVHLQNTSSLEWLRTETDEGMDIEMQSRFSHKLGPYFGWRFLFYGTTIDLNTIGKPKAQGKNEFTLSINSNLLNLDLIRRRTGGDFDIKKLRFKDGQGNVEDYTDWVQTYDLGQYIKNSLTGFNVNVFTNHRKYSNPAAFSNGAIQLRSAGTPILGFGYTHQKVESDISWVFADLAAEMATDEQGEPILTEENAERLAELYGEEGSPDYYSALYTLLDYAWPYLTNTAEKRNLARTFLTNRIPTVTRIDDWHLQLGYAYNWVFSRRLMLGASLVLSPGMKRVRANNEGSLTYEMADEFSQLILDHEGYNVSPAYFKYYFDDTHVNMNVFGRLSLTWNYNRWRAGFMATYSNYYYNHKGMDVDNAFGNLTAYVGYCFGRKKEYRHNGEKRQDYINAALTKRQIEEMRDTMPAGNLAAAPLDSRPAFAPLETKPTRKYHADHFDIDIEGCDLVEGPDGLYGTFEVEDGYITPGQDSKGRLAVGTVLPVDRNGVIELHAGHDASFRAGNWWKSQLKIDQIVNHWYPEMLYYAIKGRLTLHLRGRIFGSRKPVKMVIEDVCLNRGKEAKVFKQMGVQSFRSQSAYSIEGNVEVEGRPYRVYIEQHSRGAKSVLYVSRVLPSMSHWMKAIDDATPISRISMPGTHDSGSSSVPESAVARTGHTQNFAVSEQLCDGIRAFDIRLKSDMHYGHTMKCRDRFDTTLEEWEQFLQENPSEMLVVLVGSDEGGRWSDEMKQNYRALIDKYPHRFVEQFSPDMPIGQLRGKILVVRRQEDCPFGRLLKFENNATFQYDCFSVEDVYKEFKSWKKIKLVEQHLREAYENDDPTRWYFTFCSIAWSPRRHTPYSYAWGARNIRKPINKTLYEIIELKDYTEMGVIFMDYYNNHGENPQLVQSIVSSNFTPDR